VAASPACALLFIRLSLHPLTIRRASSSCLPRVILPREVGAFVSGRPKDLSFGPYYAR